MALTPVANIAALDELTAQGPVVLGFFGQFSQASQQAQPAFEAFGAEEHEHPVALIDVGVLKGAHKRWAVAAVPTVLLVDGEQILRKVEGSQSADHYKKALFHRGGLVSQKGDKDAPRQKPVELYVGAHCPWCTKAEQYLKQHGIQFREIDVSQSAGAAAELQAKSGRTGVPQLNIGGTWVVGFDRPQIDKLLNISPNS